MTRELYQKVGDGFYNGTWHEDGETKAMSEAEVRSGLIHGQWKPASRAAKKAFEAPSKPDETGDKTAPKKGGK